MKYFFRETKHNITEHNLPFKKLHQDTSIKFTVFLNTIIGKLRKKRNDYIEIILVHFE